MKVLIATDGSDPAVRACEWFCDVTRHMDVDVKVLTVLSYDLYPYALAAGEHLSDEAEMEAVVRAHTEEVTAGARAVLARAGYPAGVAHRFGNPGDEILAEIEAWEPDLVVLGRRNIKGLERMLGSVSQHVIRRAKVPILVVP